MMNPRSLESTLGIICPTCGESFAVVPPPPSETPCQVDYDCEICCRPLIIHFHLDNDDLVTADSQAVDQ